jgi:hypothetical protein
LKIFASLSSAIPQPLSRITTLAVPGWRFTIPNSSRRSPAFDSIASIELSITLVKTWRSLSASARTIGPPI